MHSPGPISLNFHDCPQRLTDCSNRTSRIVQEKLSRLYQTLQPRSWTNRFGRFDEDLGPAHLELIAVHLDSSQQVQNALLGVASAPLGVRLFRQDRASV